jgi:hypothetical protein
MRHNGPLVYMNHRGGLRGLGQPEGFSEEVLARKMAELEQVRAEREAVENEIADVKMGKPATPPPAAPAPPPQGPARTNGVIIMPPAPPAQPSLPGGSVVLPVVGEVPVLALFGAGAAAFFVFGRRK